MRPPHRIGFAAALLVVVSATSAFAQGVGINATGAPADTSAILDLSSSSKGLLAPRMTALQRGAIALPATGLLVYQSDGTVGLYYNAGTPGAPSWQPVGSAGASSQWTTSGSSIYYNTGSVGIGRAAPSARLDVLGGNWDVVGGEGDFRIGDGLTRLKMGIATGGGGTGAATIMEQGPVGAYNVLALGTQGNKVLYVNGTTQRIGIGLDAPNAPLGFPASLGKKITLYPGGTGDVGFAVAGNRLQIYADNPSADVAVGYDAAGTFNERFAFKPNGALAVSGNAGAAGQVLQSNGGGASATWVSPSNSAYAHTYYINSVPMMTFADGTTDAALTGLSVTFAVSGNALAMVSFNVPVIDVFCVFCGGSQGTVSVALDGVVQHRYPISVGNGEYGEASATLALPVGAGTHTVAMLGSASGKSVYFGDSPAILGSTLTIQVLEQ